MSLKIKKMYWNRPPKVQQESSQWWDVFHNRQSKGMILSPKGRNSLIKILSVTEEKAKYI